jgi:hypothetical protein
MPFAAKLVREGQAYFLSRPRRLGKSLFVDTLKELFERNRSLFDGYVRRSYPSLRPRFGAGVLKTLEDFAANLHEQVAAFEKEHAPPPAVPDLRGRFKRLIRGLHETTSQRVVGLDAEYDKPLLDNIPELGRAHRA